MRMIVGAGDERYGWLTNCAQAAGIVVDGTEEADCAVMPGGGAVPEGLRAGGLLMVFDAAGLPRWAATRFVVRDLRAHEGLERANAEMTAEGAISSVMARNKRALMDSHCLVIGFGRIGYALNERLVALGAKVTVAVRREAVRRAANQRGAFSILIEEMGTILMEQHAIFSTPPELVLDEDGLARTREDALIVDLASPPYGVDLAAAERMGRAAWREPGLPGRYCPATAGRAMWEAVRQTIEEVRGGDG